MTASSIPRAIRLDVKIVSFVRAFRGAYDRGPSLTEIMLAVGAGSKTTISRAVGRLVAAGRLVRNPDGGVAVPGDVEAAVALLQRRGFKIIAAPPELERNGNYEMPSDMRNLLDKLD